MEDYVMFLAHIPPVERQVLLSYLDQRTAPRDTILWHEGSPGDGCLLLDEGSIRLEVSTEEADADAVLGYIGEDCVVGELSLIDGMPRSASAIAHTDIVYRYLSSTSVSAIREAHPAVAAELMKSIAHEISGKLRTMNERFSDEVAANTPSQSVKDMVHRATSAQPWLSSLSDLALDTLLSDIVDAILAVAPALAEQSVHETGMGVVAHRIRKIEISTTEILADLRRRFLGGQRTDESLVQFSKPAGVIFGLVPLTNPVSTFVFKCLIALASRNAIILSCHRRGLGIAEAVGGIILTAIEAHGGPPDVVQWVRDRSSRQKTAAFMRHPDVSLILATGGPSMVRAAYMSGRPAIGVGAGNAPVLVAQDADLAQSAAWITGSKSFDNGLICGSENNVLIGSKQRAEFQVHLNQAGAFVLDGEQRLALESAILRDGALHPMAIGQDARKILAAAGIDSPENTRLIVVGARTGDETPESSGWLAREKMAPIVSLFEYETVDEGIELASRILVGFGKGHCAVVHTKDRDLALRFGKSVPASRVIVNQPASTACGGSGNDLGISFTLGCGYWGGSSTSDNVGAAHLCNRTSLAFPTTPA
jgi:acetaldehyde dehydrogenase/alcohol dehydrogenase